MREPDTGRYLNRQELFKQQVTAGELLVVHDLIFALDDKKYDGLRGVHWAMFLAGDFADSFDHPQVEPEHIPLRIALDAPRGSEIQRLFQNRMEETLDECLKNSGWPYIQKSGDKWHLVPLSYEDQSLGFVRHPDKGHNDLRFIIAPDEGVKRRRVDVIINRLRGKDIDAQLRWERDVRCRQPVILFDSKFPKSCIL